jgi:trimeric autotransporter adhesin
MNGTAYQFSPQAFTAGTINAGTVNATTLNGAVSAAQLPLFGISGSGHGRGAVPDPGATAGTTRYLREDGTWAIPGGTGGLGIGAGLSGSAAPIAGATADYNFLQGSGTVVTDNTGNGNNGTLGSGALAPAWTPQGLSFTGQNQVALPAALNSSETFVIGVYLQPLSTSLPANGFPMLVGSSLAGSGLNLLYDYANDNGTLAQSTYITAPSIYGSGAGLFTNTKNLVSGFHVLTFVLGASGVVPDHIYIDGVQATPGAWDSFSSGLQTSGNLFLGSSNTGIFGQSGLNGTMYRFAVFPGRSLTDGQILQISEQIKNDVASRGVPVAPVRVPRDNRLSTLSATRSPRVWVHRLLSLHF